MEPSPKRSWPRIPFIVRIIHLRHAPRRAGGLCVAGTAEPLGRIGTVLIGLIKALAGPLLFFAVVHAFIRTEPPVRSAPRPRSAFRSPMCHCDRDRSDAFEHPATMMRNGTRISANSTIACPLSSWRRWRTPPLHRGDAGRTLVWVIEFHSLPPLGSLHSTHCAGRSGLPKGVPRNCSRRARMGNRGSGGRVDP